MKGRIRRLGLTGALLVLLAAMWLGGCRASQTDQQGGAAADTETETAGELQAEAQKELGTEAQMEASAEVENDQEAELSSREAKAFDTEMGEDNYFTVEPFNGMIPSIFLNGRLYFWEKISVKYIVSDGYVGTPMGYSGSYLPEGYSEVGELALTTELPEQNGQIQASFELTGTVYADERYPEVIYAKIVSTEFSEERWTEGVYVRFVTDGWRNELLVNGNVYSGNSIAIEESIPEGFELLGEVVFTGQDSMPQNDLETNMLNFSEGEVNVYCHASNTEMVYLLVPKGETTFHIFGLYREGLY